MKTFTEFLFEKEKISTKKIDLPKNEKLYFILDVKDFDPFMDTIEHNIKSGGYEQDWRNYVKNQMKKHHFKKLALIWRGPYDFGYMGYDPKKDANYFTDPENNMGWDNKKQQHYYATDFKNGEKYIKAALKK